MKNINATLSLSPYFIIVEKKIRSPMQSFLIKKVAEIILDGARTNFQISHFLMDHQ